MKTASDFEETKGHEQTISLWFQYLAELAKYVQDTVMFPLLLVQKRNIFHRLQ